MMPLLEQLEQRIVERANDQFALFLTVFDQRYSQWQQVASSGDRQRSAAHGQKVKDVEALLRAGTRPTVTKLHRIAEILGSSELRGLTDHLSSILLLAGMSYIGSGGYHKLRTMTCEQLDDIARQLNSVVPQIQAIYRKFKGDASLQYLMFRQKGFYNSRPPL